jgi:hypothetical protein
MTKSLLVSNLVGIVYQPPQIQIALFLDKWQYLKQGYDYVSSGSRQHARLIRSLVP